MPLGRRPILATAVVVGASRSAAKHEIEKQEKQNARAQAEADRAADKRAREEAERARRTQLEIDAAIARDRARNEQSRAVQGPPSYGSPSYGSPSYGPNDGNRGGCRYCPACGHACQAGDAWCGKCGQRQG
jgi:hypothetical protein